MSSRVQPHRPFGHLTLFIAPGLTFSRMALRTEVIGRAMFLALMLALAMAPAASQVPPPGDYYLFGTSRSSGAGTGPATLQVVDPAAPFPVKLTVQLPSTEIGRFYAVGIGAGGEKAIVGASIVFFQKNGSLFKVPLVKPGTPKQKRFSSIVEVCSVRLAFPINADATKGMVEVTEPGADLQCSERADNRSAVAFTTDAATTAPVILPKGTVLLQGLYDSSRTMVWALATSTTNKKTKLVIYTPAMKLKGRVSDSPLSTDVIDTGDLLAVGRDQQAIYVRVDKNLHRLSWTGTGAQLSMPLYTFKSSSIAALDGVVDDTGSYFLDGLDLLVVRDEMPATLLATLESNAGPVAGAMTASESKVIAVQRGTGSVGTRVTAIDKQTGAKLVLVNSNGTNGVGFVAVANEKVAYFYYSSVSSPTELRSINTDGSLPTTLASSVTSAGILFDRTNPFFSPIELQYCINPPAAGSCRDSFLTKYNVKTGSILTLGDFGGDDGLTTFSATHVGYSGIPAGFSVLAFRTSPEFKSWEDTYIYDPDANSSLKRITLNIP